jgi:hypothetical protein
MTQCQVFWFVSRRRLRASTSRVTRRERARTAEEEVTAVLKFSKRKLIASAFAGVVLGVAVPFAPADAGGGPGSNNGCPGHQPPPPPSGGCHH